MEEEKERSRISIDHMYDKYQEDPYMISKINHYLQKQLPIILENTKNTREQNIQRMEDLSLEQEQFIQSFLHRNNYFYVSTTEKFVYYDGQHYGEMMEDHVLYNILNAISQERNPKLMSWKYKTKVSIFKRIKENKLTKTIPESETIQNVLGHFLSNKSETKYFLTILGDNIMKKNPTHIHFFSNTEIKLLLKELNQTAVYFFGNQCTQTFKTKMHEKHYEDDMKDCRIIPKIKMDRIETNAIFLIDILCVACHYSIRYGDSDNYLVRDTDLENNVIRLTKTSALDLVEYFIGEYIIDSDDKKNQMTWQNMFYLWKMFLQTQHYPPNLFQSNIKSILTTQLFEKNYKAEGDFFIGITSSQLPNIQLFLRFWNETMVTDEFETDLEIEEITGLFRLWGESLKWKHGFLKEEPILDVIAYYFPEIEMENQKYIHRVRSILWDKAMDIQIALQELAQTLNATTSQTPSLLSIYDAYLFYCKFYANPTKKTHILVSKSYFDKYMMENYNEYILENGVLSKEWLN